MLNQFRLLEETILQTPGIKQNNLKIEFSSYQKKINNVFK